MSSQRAGAGGGGDPHHYHWDDPYALGSEIGSGTEDNTEDHNVYFGGDAPARPVGSLYAASIGAHSVRGPPPQHTQEQLMYAPRYQQPHPYAAAARPQPHHDHPPHLTRSASSNSAPRVSHYAGDGYYDNAEGIGVGVIVGGSAGTDEDDYLESSMPPEPYSDLQSHTRSRGRPTVTPQPQLPSLKESNPPVPNYKPLEPVTPSPRRSHRYLKTSKRVPDIVEGSDASVVKHGNHAIICEQCRNQWQVPKTSVLMKCPHCRHVSSVTPVKLKHLPIMR